MNSSDILAELVQGLLRGALRIDLSQFDSESAHELRPKVAREVDLWKRGK